MFQESFSNDVWSLGDLSLDIMSQDVLSQDVLSGHQKTGKERHDDGVDVNFFYSTKLHDVHLYLNRREKT